MALDGAMAELAAIVATLLAAVATLPQLRRVVVIGDGRGVSVSGAILGVVNETVWITYTLLEGLWSATPEAVLMATFNGVLIVWLLRAGAGGWARATGAATLWAGVLCVVAVVGGTQSLALALGAAYAVQVAPAVWTAWRTPSPTGVAATMWSMTLVESVLWGAYGLHHADPATTTLGLVGVVASGAMVARKVARRHPTALIVR